MMKKLSEINFETRIYFYSIFISLLTMRMKISNNIFETFMIFAICNILLYASHFAEYPQYEISLFIEGEHKDRMKRSIIPAKGDTIVIDCGEAVQVIKVNHDWGSPRMVQLDCVELEHPEGEEET